MALSKPAAAIRNVTIPQLTPLVAVLTIPLQSETSSVRTSVSSQIPPQHGPALRNKRIGRYVFNSY